MKKKISIFVLASLLLILPLLLESCPRISASCNQDQCQNEVLVTPSNPISPFYQKEDPHD